MGESPGWVRLQGRNARPPTAATTFSASPAIQTRILYPNNDNENNINNYNNKNNTVIVTRSTHAPHRHQVETYHLPPPLFPPPDLFHHPSNTHTSSWYTSNDTYGTKTSGFMASGSTTPLEQNYKHHHQHTAPPGQPGDTTETLPPRQYITFSPTPGTQTPVW